MHTLKTILQRRRMMSLGNFHIIYIVKEKLPIWFFKVETMKKYFRDRKRNFVTAQTGFVGVCVLMISTIIFNFIYNFEFWTLDTYRLDSSTKASVNFLSIWSDGPYGSYCLYIDIKNIIRSIIVLGYPCNPLGFCWLASPPGRRYSRRSISEFVYYLFSLRLQANPFKMILSSHESDSTFTNVS